MLKQGRWYRVESVSFPRSGHSFTAALLQAYFGPEFKYQEFWPGPGHFSDGFHFQKNHDFDFVTPISTEWNYIVQVRDPFDAIFSWHKMSVNLDGSEDSWPKYQEALRNQQDYWSGFVKKWVTSDIPNRLIVHYADLYEKTEAVLSRMVRHFGEEPDASQIARAIQTVGIRTRRAPDLYLSDKRVV